MKKSLAPPLFSLRAKPMHWLVQFCILCCMGMGSWAHAEPDQKYLVLCYHSVPTVFNGDPDGVSVLNLAQQLAWLRESGYTAMRIIDDAAKLIDGNVEDAAAFAAALAKTNIKAPRGPVSFDQVTHQAIQNVYIRKVEKVDGVLRNEPIATVANVGDYPPNKA